MWNVVNITRMLNAFQWLLNGFSMGECVLYRTQPKQKWIFNDWMLLVHECKPFGWTGPLPFVASRLEPEADSVGRLVTLGQCLVYSSITTKSGGELASEFNAMISMNEWQEHWRSFHLQMFSNIGGIRKMVGEWMNEWLEWMAPSEHVSFQWLNVYFLNDCLYCAKRANC